MKDTYMLEQWEHDFEGQKSFFRLGLDFLLLSTETLSFCIESGVVDMADKKVLLDSRDSDLDWISGILSEISDCVYEDYVLTGDCFRE